VDLRERKYQECGENYIKQSLIIMPLCWEFYGDHLEEDEVGAICMRNAYILVGKA
jgi:hypothetical protein